MAVILEAPFDMQRRAVKPVVSMAWSLCVQADPAEWLSFCLLGSQGKEVFLRLIL